VPKKLMVFASAFPDILEDAVAYGWQVKAGAFDWPKFRTALETELNRLESAYRTTLTNAGVTIHDSRATVVDPHTVRLATGETFTTKHILIATGGWPFVPDIPGRELAITSNEIFHLDTLPARALVVGGGYIASEFACILHGLGVQVTQYYRGAQSPPMAASVTLIWCSTPPAAAPTARVWGWKPWASSLAATGRWWWMPGRKPPCPRSLPWAMSPTAST
jgi:glutathione reductase (NADPH)